MNMLFWDDGLSKKTRIRNVKFSWRKLKELNQYLNDHDIKSEAKLFDFSYNQIIDDAIHKPYPVGVFQKSKKLNEVISQCNSDFFMMFDCDAFFDNQDYDSLVAKIKMLNDGDIITFDLAKLFEEPENYINGMTFNRSKANWRYAYSGDRNLGPLYHCCGGLGGVFIIDLKLLLNVNGFNEKFKGWGQEDNDALDRIMTSKQPHQVKPVKDFAPFHLPHDVDLANPLYSCRF